MGDRSFAEKNFEELESGIGYSGISPGASDYTFGPYSQFTQGAVPYSGVHAWRDQEA